MKVFRNLQLCAVYVAKTILRYLSYKLASYLLYQFKGKGNMGDIYTQYTLYICMAILRGPWAGGNGPCLTQFVKNLNETSQYSYVHWCS